MKPISLNTMAGINEEQRQEVLKSVKIKQEVRSLFGGRRQRRGLSCIGAFWKSLNAWFSRLTQMD